MEHLNVLTALLGALVLVLGLPSALLARSPLPPTVLALLAGVLAGPVGAGWLDLSALGDRTRVLEGLARLTLGIGLVGVALRIPRGWPGRHWRPMALMLTAGMVLMWLVTSALVSWVLGLPLLLAAIAGAALAAADPIAASPIVTGKLAERSLPERLRHAISLESGANDGLTYLLVFLPFLLLTRPAGEALSHWFLRTLLYEVGVATIAGLAIGYAAARLLQWTEARDLIDREWRLVYTVALALFTVGAGRLVDSDEILVVFAAGMAFGRVVSKEDRENEGQGQEAVNRFFSFPIFVVIGAAIPWAAWAGFGWRGVALAVAVLLLRRLPAVLLLRPGLTMLHGRADVLFFGWFAPMAVSAVYYATLMEHRMGEARIWHVVSLVVCASVLAHGVTAAPFTRWYARATRPPDPA